MIVCSEKNRLYRHDKVFFLSENILRALFLFFSFQGGLLAISICHIHTVRIGRCLRVSSADQSSKTSGVPQGSVLGPTLFLLFINDICDIFDGLRVKCKLYADDIKLYSCYDVNSSRSELLVAISRLYRPKWSCLWQLQIAVEKCFVCTVSNSRHNMQRGLSDERLSVCLSVKRVNCDKTKAPSERVQ